MPPVLVTGGAGFIGSHTMAALLQRGERVICLDNFDVFYPRVDKERNLTEIGTSDRLTVIEGDIRDLQTVTSVFATYQPDRVVHLAAKAGVRPSLQHPEEYLEVNGAGALNVIKAAAEANVTRLVFGSSSSVYGGCNALPYNEEQNVARPLSPYAATKLAGELFCHTYHCLHGLPVVVLRFFTVYGPRQRPDLAINKFVRLLQADETIPMFGDGTSSRDYTYVADIVSGILAALDSDLQYEVINLGNSHPVSLRTLIEELAAVMGREPCIEQLPAQPGDMLHTFADIGKARRLLGWQPQMSLRDGLTAYIEWQAKR